LKNSVIRLCRVLVLKVVRPIWGTLSQRASWNLPGAQAFRRSEWVRQQTLFSPALIDLQPERERQQLRAHELDFAFVDLDRVKAEANGLAKLSEVFAIEHRVLPVKLAGSDLWAAIDNRGEPSRDRGDGRS
jgi:hypothetical protein